MRGTVTIASTNSHIGIGSANTLNYRDIPDKHLFIRCPDTAVFSLALASTPSTKKPEKSNYDMKQVIRVFQEGAEFMGNALV